MPTVQILRGDKTWSIEATRQLSLLDLALASGLPVNYSCKRGDCGQCLGKLLTGNAAALEPGRPLMREGEIYLCNAVACEDLTVEIPYVPELDGIRTVRSPCKIHELLRLSDDVLQVGLRLPPAVRFEYLPGQYIRLTNKDRLTRSYSLAAAPAPDQLLRIHVQRITGGAFSQYVFESAKLADLLHLEGPMGQFILRSAMRAQKTLFLATGTGIAPIYAMLSSLNDEQLARCGALYLYWGNRRHADAYLHTPLAALTERLGLHYCEVFSREPHARTSQGARHVQQLMAAQHADLAQAQVFGSGNPAMVADGRKCAVSLGLPAARFFADAFTAS